MAISNKFIVAFAILCFAGIKVIDGLAIHHESVDYTTVDGCHSQIYCHGELLHTVQMAKLFNDSKTFVDMKLKLSPDVVRVYFNNWKERHGGVLTQDVIREFVNTYFEKRSVEFTEWEPKDWRPSPKFLANIRDPNYKKFASDLNALWKKLGRKMIDDVSKNPDFYSIIYVKNPVIVPGGRFLEFYYWDSYWVIRGLLQSEMYQTVKGMLENFISIIDRFGFIPNGGRLYYLERSQPPLLPGMIKSYVEATGDIAFMISALPALEREFDFFLTNRTVNVLGHTLATYRPESTGPRPESYAEDYNLAQSLPTEEERERLYSELKAAAESGMDFSSRWFVKDGTNEGSLIDTKCRSIIPVELNAILYWNAKILAEFHIKVNNIRKAAYYELKAYEFYQGIQAILWNKQAGTWLDYDMINNKSRNYFVPTNLSPLWVGCFNKSDKVNLAEKTLNYIKINGLDLFPGGVPNSMMQVGEQWDYPNVWPPMQYICIEALRALNDANADRLAMKWTSRWVLSNYLAFERTGAMYEKYNAAELGGTGDGGEYGVQLGFGWSNGVILEYLARNGNILSSAHGG